MRMKKPQKAAPEPQNAAPKGGLDTLRVDDLSAAESRLLDVLTNPAHRGRTITKLCELARINRKSYYRIMARPAIAEAANRILNEIAGDGLVSAFEAMVASAKVVGPQGFADRKLLMELTGKFVPTKRRIDERKPAVGNLEGEAMLVTMLVNNRISFEHWPTPLLDLWRAGKIPEAPPPPVPPSA